MILGGFMKKLFTISLVSLLLLTGCNDKCEKCEKCECEKETIKDCICNCVNEPIINEDLVGKTFTKTYKIYNIADSNDYNYIYITVREFQGEEIETVKVERELFETLEEEYYEFTFKITDGRITENIKNIFEYTELLSATKTDKTGLEQINDYLDDLK